MTVNTNAELRGIVVKSRPTNYGVNQISFGVAAEVANATTLVSTITSVDFSSLILTRNTVGQTIAMTSTITVATGTSNYKTYTVQTAPHNLSTSQAVFIKGGSNSAFDYPAGAVVASVVSSAQFSILATGASGNSTGGETLAFPNATAIWSTTTATSVVTTTLGIASTYTVFDDGSNTARTSSPGKGVTGTTDVQGKEAFYSLFICDTGTPKFRRVRDFSQVFTKNYGTSTAPSTKQLMLNYLPEFYKKTNSNLNNTDLEDFISLFAFEYDTWRTLIDLLFDYSDPSKTESNLLVALLKQLGVGISSIGDYSQARKTLENVVRSYKGKGSYDTMDLVAEMITGYDSVISTTPDVNLLPDQNATSLTEGNSKKPAFWTVDPGTAVSNLGGVGTDRKPSIFRIGGKANSFSTAYSITPYNENGVLQLSATNTGTAVITGAPRKIVTTSSVIATGSTTLQLQYGDVYVNDYIIGDPFPYGTYITSVTSPTTTSLSITISNSTTASITASSSYVVTQAGPDKVSAYSKLVPVATNTTYTWSLYANAGGYTLGPITPIIAWYTLDGTIISTSTGVAVAGTTAVASSGWYLVSMSAASPATAALAAPAFSILRSAPTPTSINGKYYFDGFQFETGSTVTTFANPAKTVIISTAPSTRPRDTILENRFKNIIPDYIVNGFLPQNISAGTHTVINVTSPSTLSNGIPLEDPVTGVVQTYPTATITLKTATTNIVVGQSFSLKGGISSTATATNNDIDYGVIIGVISTKEYRILARSISGTTLTETTATYVSSTSPSHNNLYVNVVHQPTWTINS